MTCEEWQHEAATAGTENHSVVGGRARRVAPTMSSSMPAIAMTATSNSNQYSRAAV